MKANESKMKGNDSNMKANESKMKANESNMKANEGKQKVEWKQHEMNSKGNDYEGYKDPSPKATMKRLLLLQTNLTLYMSISMSM